MAKEAFCIPAADPEDDRCLFSGVLIEGLRASPGFTKSRSSRVPMIASTPSPSMAGRPKAHGAAALASSCAPVKPDV